MNEEEEIYSLNDKDTIVQTVKTSLPYKPPPPPPPPRPARPARNLKIEIPAKFFTEIEGNTISKEPVNIKAISADLSQIPNDHINQHGEPEIKIREEVGTKKGKKKRRKSLTALIEGRLNPHSTQGANIQVPITPEPKQSHSFFKNDSLSSRRIKSLRMKEPLPFSQSQKVNMPQRPEPVNRIRNLKNFQSEMCNQTDILEQKPQSLDDYTNPNGDRNQLKRKLENNFTRANIEKNLQLKMVKETQQKETPKLAQFRATRKDTISKLTSNWSELESQILEKPENQENQLRWSQYTNTNIESIRIRSLVNSARICEGVSNHMKNIEELLNDFKTSSMKRKVPSIDSPPSSASSNFNSPPVANTPVSSLSPRPRSPSFNSHYLYSSSDSSLQPRVPPLPVPSLPPSHPPPPPPERKKLAPKEATAKLTTSSESTSQSSDIPEIDTKDESLEKVNAEDLPAPIISPRMPIPLNSNEPHPPVPNYPPPPLPIPPVPTPKRERTAVITTPPSIMSPINKPPPPPPLKTKKRLAGSHPLSSSNSDSIIASPRLVLSAQPANFNMSAPDSMVGASSIAVPPLALSNMHDISNLIMFNAPNTQHGQNTLYMNTLATPNTSLPISIPFHSSNQPSSSGLSVSAPLTSLPPPSLYLRAQCQPPPPPPQSPPIETPLEAFTSPCETKESTDSASIAIQEPSTSSSNVGNGEVMLRQKIHDPKKRKDRKSKKFSWLKKQTNPSEQKGRNFVSKILSEGDQSLTKDKFVQQLISQTKLREILDEKQLKSLPTLFFAEFQAADDSQNIEFDKKDEKSIVFCTIFKLIEKVTQKEKKKDPHLLSVFLLTFRNLISAQHLLELLVFRAFAVPPDEKQHSEWISKHQIQIQTKIISILTKWIKLYSYDFEPPYMSFILSYFVSFLLNSDHPFADSAVSLLFRTIGDAVPLSLPPFLSPFPLSPFPFPFPLLFLPSPLSLPISFFLFPFPSLPYHR